MTNNIVNINTDKDLHYKIIDFINAFKKGTHQNNFDYQHAIIALNDDPEAKKEFMTAVSTIAGILKPRELIDEKLYLDLSYYRNCVTSIKGEIYTTITEKAWNDVDLIDLTDEDLSGIELSDSQRKKTQKLFVKYKTQLSQLSSKTEEMEDEEYWEMKIGPRKNGNSMNKSKKTQKVHRQKILHTCL